MHPSTYNTPLNTYSMFLLQSQCVAGVPLVVQHGVDCYTLLHGGVDYVAVVCWCVCVLHRWRCVGKVQFVLYADQDSVCVCIWCVGVCVYVWCVCVCMYGVCVS